MDTLCDWHFQHAYSFLPFLSLNRKKEIFVRNDLIGFDTGRYI